MVTLRDSVSDRHHVVCDDSAFWQWSSAMTVVDAHQHADLQAADPRSGFERIWVVPCAGVASCVICHTPTAGTPYEDDTFTAVTAGRVPYWQRRTA